MSACIHNILDKYDGAGRIGGGKDYDIVLLPGFAAKLGKEPAEWQQELVQKYPVCGAGEAIVPGRVQWVSVPSRSPPPRLRGTRYTWAEPQPPM